MIHIGGLDLETTGFLDPEHRIIECCIQRYTWDGTVADLVFEKTWRIDPQRPIEAKAQEVHKISNADLIGAPKLVEVAGEICDTLNGCQIVVAHNGYSFDFPFLQQELERIRHPLPDFEPFDTMINGRWATPMGEAPSLQGLCFACGVDYDETSAHAADYDVKCMMKCLFFGLKRGVFTLRNDPFSVDIDLR